MIQPFTPYARDSQTSMDAAISAIPNAKKGEERVREHIRKCGSEGATDDEVEVALSMRHQTASARRRGLVMAGEVVDSGTTRRTSSGRNATVWVLREFAKPIGCLL